ncbi:ferrous iron transport protein A [Actinopolyspora erythraea]|uniref:Ferrous iron transport protein A n=1 Tax=Actinopolyspora erythraea TaxID=414996 RepID=A0A099D6E6_9ACTN|nr:FeoA family protein [Actinopolyspora erythraea]ASU78652.1 ferrous iron transport protein A [Actinopolyspora erythraea]KGI81412.1 iron transporter FeoA [Actinopolyspora erythraea]
MTTTLDRLRNGQTATVTALDVDGAERRRLMDLGVLPGTPIHVDRVSPLGDPTAYLVRGSVIALRRHQARGIHITIGQG